MYCLRSLRIAGMASMTLAIMLVWTLSACARSTRVNTTADGVAIKGYDPVAYFTDGRPVEGSVEHEYEWMGAKWRFATAEHLRMFADAPDKYAPQYGGY